MACVEIKQCAGDQCNMKSIVAGRVKRALVTSRRCGASTEPAVREERSFQDSRTTRGKAARRKGPVWHCWMAEVETGDEAPRSGVPGHVDPWVSCEDHGVGNL